MRKFNKLFAERYVAALCKKHKIQIYKTSVTSSGHAHIKERMIKAPKPTNIDRFAVCLHEIKHIIDGKFASSFKMEFACDTYALNILKKLRYETIDWDSRIRWHILMCIAKAHNRGLNHSNISKDIRLFFKEVDFETWISNKVFVNWHKLGSNDKGRFGYKIQLTPNLSKEEITLLLSKAGLNLSKSQADDSTNGKWIVSTIKGGFGYSFNNLSEIIIHFKLSK